MSDVQKRRLTPRGEPNACPRKRRACNITSNPESVRRVKYNDDGFVPITLYFRTREMFVRQKLSAKSSGRRPRGTRHGVAFCCFPGNGTVGESFEKRPWSSRPRGGHVYRARDTRMSDPWNTSISAVTWSVSSAQVRYSPKMARLSLTVSVLASGAAGAATAAATRAKAINTCATKGRMK